MINFTFTFAIAQHLNFRHYILSILIFLKFNTVRVTAAEAPGGSAYSNYFGGTLMKRNLVVLTK